MRIHAQHGRNRDRNAGYSRNRCHLVIGLPDFGVQGVVDRFGQIEPKLMITVDGYHYNGKSHDIREKVRDVVDRITTIQKVVIVKYAFDGTNTTGIRNGVSYDNFLAPSVRKRSYLNRSNSITRFM